MKIYTKIKLIPIDAIKPYFNNPRKNEKTVVALTEAIKKVGFNVPLVIDKQNVIIKGHSRYYAAKNLELKELPCIISENDDKQNNADRIYDNAIQDLSEWNNEKLALELRELDFQIPELDFDLGDINSYLGNTNDLDNIYNKKTDPKALEKALDKINNETKDDEQTLIIIPCSKCGNESLVSIEDLTHYKTFMERKPR